MKRISIIFSVFVLSVVFVLVGCKKDLDKYGLTKEINEILPQNVLDSMLSIGVTINGGDKPPTLEGSYVATPYELKSSNIPSDYVGREFADMYVTFYDFNKDSLTVKVDYTNGPEAGTGLGSYIVGKKNKFSVFSEITTSVNGNEADVIFVFTGELQSDGIKDFECAVFMVDDHGDPDNYYIENGQGRLIIDQDGLAELTSSKKVNLKKLPSGFESVVGQ